MDRLEIESEALERDAAQGDDETRQPTTTQSAVVLMSNITLSPAKDVSSLSPVFILVSLFRETCFLKW